VARPRVFISSTFYDLKILRADLDAMLAQLGYDPVLNERGRIPYEKHKKLEQSCYREIENCDIVISVIGGRFGSVSAVDDCFSISRLELQHAIDLDKQVFIFVERSVMVEYGTWAKNRTAVVKWTTVDDARVFEFLEFVSGLPRNNPIHPFEVAADVTVFLKEQFAGLFQRMLSEHEERADYSLASQLKSTAETLNAALEAANAEKRVTERSDKSSRLPDLIFANQDLFQQVRRVLHVSYRVFFTSVSELTEWLKSRRFKPVPEEGWDSGDTMEWIRDKEEPFVYDILKVSEKVFDDHGNVRYIPPSEWDKSFVRLEKNRYTGDDEEER
jgi:hypothetical protein